MVTFDSIVPGGGPGVVPGAPAAVDTAGRAGETFEEVLEAAEGADATEAEDASLPPADPFAVVMESPAAPFVLPVLPAAAFVWSVPGRGAETQTDDGQAENVESEAVIDAVAVGDCSTAVNAPAGTDRPVAGAAPTSMPVPQAAVSEPDDSTGAPIARSDSPNSGALRQPPGSPPARDNAVAHRDVTPGADGSISGAAQPPATDAHAALPAAVSEDRAAPQGESIRYSAHGKTVRPPSDTHAPPAAASAPTVATATAAAPAPQDSPADAPAMSPDALPPPSMVGETRADSGRAAVDAARLAAAIDRAAEPSHQLSSNGDGSAAFHHGEGETSMHFSAPAPAAPNARSAAAPVFSVPPAVPASPAPAPVAVAAAAAADLPAADPGPEVLPQLVQAMRVQVRDGIGEAVLRLKPEHLGEVSIALRVEQNAVSATVHADAASVRQMLEAQEPALRQALAEHGLDLAKLVVKEDGRPRQEHPRQEQPPSRQRRDARDDEVSPRFEVTV